jgi:7-carboxy-7-deazaguanine synthase
VFLLQPLDAGVASQTRENTAAALAYCLSHPLWRLSLQTHKLLDIR